MRESAVNDRPESSPAATRSARADGTRDLFPQTRALEIHLPARFDEADAPRLVWQVHQAGFNTILLNCFRRGYTLYPSPAMRARGLPEQDPRCRARRPVAAMLEAARDEGLTAYALADGLYVGDGKRAANPILRRHPEWAVRGRRGANGGAAPPFLCPVNREVRRFLGDIFYEILERYPFRGLYVRHLHLPLEPPDRPADYCRCDYCRRAAWHSLGVRIESIPDDPDHPDRYNLDAWRTKQLAGLLRYLRLRAIKSWAEPLLLAETYLGEDDVSPARCGLQDPSAWARERFLPIVAFQPLPDTSEDSEAWIQRIAAMTQWAVAMPVLSALRDSPLEATLDRVAREPIAGVVVRAPHDLTAPPLNRLARGPFREPTQVAEDNPLASVRALLARTTDLLGPDDALMAFLTDVLRVVEPLGDRWPAAQRKMLYENLRGLEEKIEDRKVEVGDAAPAILRNFRLARQLLRLVEIES